MPSLALILQRQGEVALPEPRCCQPLHLAALHDNLTAPASLLLGLSALSSAAQNWRLQINCNWVVTMAPWRHGKQVGPEEGRDHNTSVPTLG